jgi:hypothetical protein
MFGCKNVTLHPVNRSPLRLELCAHNRPPLYFCGLASSKIQSSMEIFHHKLLTREGKILANERTHPSYMTTLVHLFTGSVIQKVIIVT